jgi:hypothetical protein
MNEWVFAPTQFNAIQGKAMRDYTGNNPKFKIKQELIIPAEIRGNRWAPLKGSFYSGSVVIIDAVTSEPFVDFTFKGLDVSTELHTAPLATPVYMYLEFPNGLNKDLLLSYQAVDLRNVAQTDALNDLLNNLSNVADEYFEEDIKDSPAALLPSVHSHKLSTTTTALISSKLLSLFNQSPEDLTADRITELGTYLTSTAQTLNTDEKVIVLALNDLVRAYFKVVNGMNNTLLATPGGLNTVATLFVPAVNEVATAINVAASGSDSQFDLYGYIYTDVNLSRSMTGGSKVWLIKARSIVTGLYSDGAAAKTLEAGDTLYYENTLGRLVYAPLGVSLSLKQSVNDERIVGDDKSVMNVINAQVESIDILAGGNTPALLGVIGVSTNLTVNLSGFTTAGYLLVTANTITVTAPYQDGLTFKVVNRTDILVFDTLSRTFTVRKLSDIQLPMQSSVDVNLDTLDKSLDGAINELYVLSEAAVNSDVLSFKGTINTNVTLQTQTTSALWFLTADCVVTADFTDSTAKTLSIGAVIIYNKNTNKFLHRSINLTGKQLLVDSRLTTESNNVVTAINAIGSDIVSISGTVGRNFQGYLRVSTDISSLCTGVSKEWIVSVDSIAITAPYNDGVGIKVLSSGTVIKYASGIITLDTVANYSPGYVGLVEPDIIGLDKRPANVLSDFQINGVGSGYQTGDIFETHANVSPNDAIPLGSAPLPRTDYPALFEVIGTNFGNGPGAYSGNYTNIYNGSIANASNSVPCILGTGGHCLFSIQGKVQIQDLVTKVITEIPLVISGDIGGFVSIPNTTVYYVISMNGSVYVASTTGEYGLTTTPTLIYTGAANTAGTVMHTGEWWNGDDVTGTGILGFVSAVSQYSYVITQLDITAFNVAVLKVSITKPSVLSGWNKYTWCSSDDALYVFCPNQTTHTARFGYPYNGNAVVTPTSLGVIHHVLWDVESNTFLAASGSDVPGATNITPSLTVFDLSFKLIETLPLSGTGPARNIARNPLNSKLLLVTVPYGPITIIYQDEIPLALFGIPPKYKGVLKEIPLIGDTAQLFTPLRIDAFSNEAFPLGGVCAMCSVPVDATNLPPGAEFISANVKIEANGNSRIQILVLDINHRVLIGTITSFGIDKIINKLGIVYCGTTGRFIISSSTTTNEKYLYLISGTGTGGVSTTHANVSVYYDRITSNPAWGTHQLGYIGLRYNGSNIIAALYDYASSDTTQTPISYWKEKDTLTTGVLTGMVVVSSGSMVIYTTEDDIYRIKTYLDDPSIKLTPNIPIGGKIQGMYKTQSGRVFINVKTTDGLKYITYEVSNYDSSSCVLTKLDEFIVADNPTYTAVDSVGPVVIGDRTTRFVTLDGLYGHLVNKKSKQVTITENLTYNYPSVGALMDRYVSPLDGVTEVYIVKTGFNPTDSGGGYWGRFSFDVNILLPNKTWKVISLSASAFAAATSKCFIDLAVVFYYTGVVPYVEIRHVQNYGGPSYDFNHTWQTVNLTTGVSVPSVVSFSSQGVNRTTERPIQLPTPAIGYPKLKLIGTTSLSATYTTATGVVSTFNNSKRYSPLAFVISNDGLVAYMVEESTDFIYTHLRIMECNLATKALTPVITKPLLTIPGRRASDLQIDRTTGKLYMSVGSENGRRGLSVWEIDIKEQTIVHVADINTIGGAWWIDSGKIVWCDGDLRTTNLKTVSYEILKGKTQYIKS